MSAVTNIGYFRQRLVATPVISAAAYSAGQLIGGRLSLAAAGRGAGDPGTTTSGIIESLTLSDKANQKSALDVVFFVADPTGTTFTDRAAAAIAAADLLNAFHVSLGAGDYASLAASTNAVATKGNLNIAYALPVGTSLFACLISRGTPTYASASDLALTVMVRKD